MSIPSFNEWKESNRGRSINEYYKAFPDARVSNNPQPPIIIQIQTQKRRGSDWRFLIWIILTIMVGIGVYLGVQQYNQSQLISYEKAVEYHEPLEYLVLYNTTGDVRLLRKSILKGTIENKSNHTTYVNIFITIEFYDKNGDYFEKEKIAIGERMEPLDYKDFELKTRFPLQARSYQIKLASAEVLRQSEN